MKCIFKLWNYGNHTSEKKFVRIFFVANDNSHVDLLNPQMLKCIFCWSQQTFGNILNQSSFVDRKGFITYGKNNGITLMKTHVDNVHLHLFAKRKYVLSERVMVKLSKIDYSQQHGKKKVGAIGFTITSFLGSTNLYKNVDETQQKFIEDLMLCIYKGYMPFFNL
jgi:hypothetical protein